VSYKCFKLTSTRANIVDDTTYPSVTAPLLVQVIMMDGHTFLAIWLLSQRILDQSLVVMPLEFYQGLWYQKTRFPGAVMQHFLHDRIFSHFGTVAACDGQTDNGHSIYHASKASHG